MPWRVRDLAPVLGRKPCIVHRHLADLQRYALAVRARDGWRRGPANPHDVEVRLGVAAQLERDRPGLYQQERIADAGSRDSVRRRS